MVEEIAPNAFQGDRPLIPEQPYALWRQAGEDHTSVIRVGSAHEETALLEPAHTVGDVARRQPQRPGQVAHPRLAPGRVKQRGENSGVKMTDTERPFHVAIEGADYLGRGHHERLPRGHLPWTEIVRWVFRRIH